MKHGVTKTRICHTYEAVRENPERCEQSLESTVVVTQRGMQPSIIHFQKCFG